jgi:hypothetical protein
MTPPPGPGPVPVGARPPMVTAAAVLFFIFGGLGVLLGLVFLLGSTLSGIFTIIGVILLLISATQIYAGVLIMGGQERGRMLGIILAGIGALLQVISIAKTPAFSIVYLLVYGFIIYALVQNASYFRKA